MFTNFEKRLMWFDRGVIMILTQMDGVFQKCTSTQRAQEKVSIIWSLTACIRHITLEAWSCLETTTIHVRVQLLQSTYLFQGTSHPNICWYVTLMVIGYALIIALGWSGGLGSSIQSIYLSFIFYLVYLLIRIRFFTMWIFLKPTPLWHHVIEVGW